MIHYNTKISFDNIVMGKPGTRVIELGDQYMNINEGLQSWTDAKGKFHGTRSRDYYANFGVEIESIDRNGNAEYTADLSKPVKGIEPADVVSDFGTMEHVESLYGALKNAFSFCKAGGTMIHANPETGSFKNHGFHYFTEEFWREYANAAGLILKEVFRYQAYGPRSDNDGWEVYAVLVKDEESKFPSKSVFEKIQSEYVFTE